eukprot:CAMPEP_0116147466 /NCGR_PEP_ID=MMETSP0329-20121206/17768_1 /TAXON_ID=697910 /ORGANISM="Pseudo-nitzschia arenysensis, Strain B593" /LENGTH=932 /DNA_ID=CAMNT_0003643393 /DNA_START=121 /DNA_END=2919 /DNA_ORIENTATION=+
MPGTHSTADILGMALQDIGSMEDRSPHSTIEETMRNITSNSRSYSSSLDSSRSHLRLKMSSGVTKAGLGPSTMKIPSLLQKLPCHGSSNNLYPNFAASGSSQASAVAFSALNVLENGLEEQESGGNFGQSQLPPVNLDAIDLDNISIGDLHGLNAGDGDTLRAKHLNKLSRKEREHVLQDIHGVADVMEEAANLPVVNDLLEQLQVELDTALAIRKANKKAGKDTDGQNKEGPKDNQLLSPVGESISKHESLQEELGKLQEKLDKIVRQRHSLDRSITGKGDFSSRKQLSAKNHALFGKLGDMGGFGSFSFGPNSGTNTKSRNSIRPSAVPSSCFGGSSSFFNTTSNLNTNEAQEDAAILNSKDSTAYEQALALCRRHRRDRQNSVFHPNAAEDSGVGCDDLDDGLHIDVEQREFRLSFLRAERFDTKKAATRMIDYFEEKRRLFGVEKVTSKIQLKDLDNESRYCLESGQLQLLPGRDRAGRAVIVETKKLAINNQHQHSILRALWVLTSIALEDVETEKNGAVFVKYDIGGAVEGSNNSLRRQMRDWGNVLQALPLRIASMHWCVQNNVLKEAAYLSALMLGGSIFVRVRCHAGPDMEVQYKLMQSGIPTDLFPVSNNGQIDLTRHTDFLQQRKKMEASTLLTKALALVEAPIFDDCNALDVCDGGQNLEAMTGRKRDRFPTTPMMSSGTMNNNRIDNLHQNQSDYQQDNMYNNNNNNNNNMNMNMNKMTSPFNDPFGFVGNRNPMQVQSSMQQQYEHRRQQQQMLNDFQQQQLGMNMGMGMIQQFPQGQQVQQKKNPGLNSNSKSGIPYSMEPVLVPGELDILLGRGRGAQNHKGNIHYRQVIETFRSRYEQIPQKGAKTQLIREVVAVIYDNGGRFLKQDGFGRWIPVDPEVARDKVSHSFRNQKRLSTGAINSSESSSKKRSRDESL